jgi:hypothetical protein
MAVTINGSAGVTTNAGGSVNPSTNVEGINYSCRAWVNFNGTGTVAIRASGNVTSITDNGTGDYTVNFTTAMPDANYAVSMSIFPTSSAAERPELTTLLAASVRVVNDDGANNKSDTSTFTVGIFR